MEANLPAPASRELSGEVFSHQALPADIKYRPVTHDPGDPDHIREVLAGAVVARLQGLCRQLAARHRLGALLQDLGQNLASGANQVNAICG